MSDEPVRGRAPGGSGLPDRFQLVKPPGRCLRRPVGGRRPVRPQPLRRWPLFRTRARTLRVVYLFVLNRWS